MGERPITIGVDARYGLRSPRRGVGEYVYQVFRELGHISHPAYRLMLFGDESADANVVAEFQEIYPVVIQRAPNFFLWEQVAWPKRARRLGVQILHGTANIGPVVWHPLLLTVHDVIEWHRGIDFPGDISLRHRMSRTYRMNTLRALAPRSKAILTVSQHAATDIALHLGVATKRIRVTPLAGKWPVEVRWEDDGPDPYFLALGAEDPRKNLEGLLTALSRTKTPGIRLKVVGIEDKALPVYRQRVHHLGLQGQVTLEGMVSDAVLLGLIRNARGFVYPSYYEGFGLPVLEAMSQGCPVIASNGTAVAEVANGAGLLVDPRDSESMATALDKLWRDKALRQQISKAGLERCRSFTWRKAAEETHKVYAEVAENVAP